MCDPTCLFILYGLFCVIPLSGSDKRERDEDRETAGKDQSLIPSMGPDHPRQPPAQVAQFAHGLTTTVG